jgi:CRP/FNR family cyclic AMP-dependent transcriptional regulator
VAVTQAAIGAGVAAQAALSARNRPIGRLGPEWVGVLAEIPLFAELSKRHLRRVAAIAGAKRFAEGSQIIRAGDPGDAFYVLLEGAAEARPRSGRAVTLGPGDFFGEMALLDGSPRSASVHATTEVLTMRLGRPAFVRLLKDEPAIATRLLVTLAGRVRGLETLPAG